MSLRITAGVAIATVLVLCFCSVNASVDPTTWNYNTGYTYLMFAYAAYCPKSQLQSWTCKWCHNNTDVSSFVPAYFPYDAKTTTFGFIGYSTSFKQIVVSFRGSSDVRDWILDFEFGKMHPYKNYTNVEVEKGFDKAWSSVESQVISNVKSLLSKYPGYSVLVTGHSLGAAIATLAAVEISQFAKTYVWNYGSPRVGNQNFSQLFRQAVPTTYRVVNDRDIVPHLPPQLFTYYHVPTEVWERGTSPSSFTVCNSSGEDPNCSDSVKVPSIEDHLEYFGVHESCN